MKGDRARIIRAMLRAGHSDQEILDELGCSRQAIASARKHEPRDAVVGRLELTIADLKQRVLQLETTIASYHK